MKNYQSFSFTAVYMATASLFASSSVLAMNDGFFQDGVTSSSERASDTRTRESDVNRAKTAVLPKNSATKTITNFTSALRCMDELFLANGKKDIAITSPGIPDATGKARAGDKYMLTTAISNMTRKSGAFIFTDFLMDASQIDGALSKYRKETNNQPTYYITGAVTQLDDNAVKESKGAGFSLPWFDSGYAKDKTHDVISMDMYVVETATGRILQETSTSNTMVIAKENRSGELGGKIFTLGLSFSKDVSRSEGVGATYRTLIELGLIETLGKFTRVPYWKCLDNESSSNPEFVDKVREWYDVANASERILFVQRKLKGMSRYMGSLDGEMNDDLKKSITEYQIAAGLTPNGQVNFDLYFSLKDDIQNQLAALPTEPAKKVIAQAEAFAKPQSGAVTNETSVQINFNSDRGNTPAYKVGEFLDLKMMLSEKGTAYCFYEDVAKNTARIFPNRFHRDSMLNGKQAISLTTKGFKIVFDKQGQERIACIASDRALIAPTSLSEALDLETLKTKSLEEIISQFKKINPIMNSNIININVK